MKKDPGADRPEHMAGEVQASVHYSNHDLREMFSRENAERRRSGGRMLRACLTAAQDKKCMAQMVKIREAYQVANNDDIVLKWVQMQVEAGNADDIDADLLEAAAKVTFPERTEPWDDQRGH